MSGIDKFPQVGQFYHTRRGKFEVLSIKRGMATIQWQDNMDKLEIEVDEIKKRLIPEQYSGDAQTYRPNDDEKIRFRKPIQKSIDEDDEPDEDEE